jgi:hypothetical protein
MWHAGARFWLTIPEPGPLGVACFTPDTNPIAVLRPGEVGDTVGGGGGYSRIAARGAMVGGPGAKYRVQLGSLALAPDVPVDTGARSVEGTVKPDMRRMVGAHVLVVDDSEANRRFASFVLKKIGCIVTLATDGDEVVRAVGGAAATDRPFDLVLMDLVMVRARDAE